MDPFVFGVTTPAPRAVPSDAVAVALSEVFGPGAAQSAFLVSVLTAAGIGAARLLREVEPAVSTLPTIAATLMAQWNPFVGERLGAGHWPVLLGYALVPFLLREIWRLRRDEGSIAAVAVLVAVAGCGGANAMVTAGVPTALALAWPRPQWRALAVAGLVAAGVSAVWALPALVHGVAAGSASPTAFAVRGEGPLGVVGAVLAGGGMWNETVRLPGDSHGLAGILVAMLMLTGVTWTLRRSVTRFLAGAALASVVLTLLGAVSLTIPLWQFLVLDVPGGGLLRDAQKLLAGWAIVGAVGVGGVVRAILVGGQRIAERRPAGWRAAAAAPVAVVVTIAPVFLTATLAWGISGRLAPTTVPADYLSVASAAASSPGRVAVVPWQQYRRYDWNDGRVSLTIAPRVIDSDVLFDDALPLRGEVVPGEDVVAAQVTQALAAGVDLPTALRAVGISRVFVERGSPGAPDPAELGMVVLSTEHAALVDLGTASPATSSGARPTAGLVLLGWVVFGATLLITAAFRLSARQMSPRLRRLLGFAP